MAKLAVFSDVHADAAALRDALACIADMKCDAVVCAGDLVDYGTSPGETLEILQKSGVPAIRGNHDRWANGPSASNRAWDVTAHSLTYLQALPAAWDVTLEGVRVAVRHGTPRSDMRGIYPRYTAPGELRDFLDEAKADVLVVGHTHIPFRIAVGDRLIVNPGALLRDPGPRMKGRPILFDPKQQRFVAGPGPAGGTFGVLELPEPRFTVYRAVDGSKAPLLEMTV